MIVVKHDRRDSTGGVWNHDVKVEARGFHHCMWVHGSTRGGSHSSPLLGGSCQCLCHLEMTVTKEAGAKSFIDSEQAEHRKIDAQEKLDSCKPTIDTAAAIRSRRISGTRRCSEVPVPGKNIGSVNGAWGSWTSWSLCNNLEIERERTCDSPAPKNQGHPCEGPSLQTAACGHHFR